MLNQMCRARETEPPNLSRFSKPTFKAFKPKTHNVITKSFRKAHNVISIFYLKELCMF